MNSHADIQYDYMALTYPALLIVVGFLIVRYWAQLGEAKRWAGRRYNRLNENLRGLIGGYVGVAIAELWLNVLHWSGWLLITLSVGAVVYTFVSSFRQSRRDMDKRIRQMLDKHRSTIQGVSFLTGTFLLAMGYAWLRWILTHTPE